ncbi:hypothetical protein Lal_00043007 [Lupinus albus]|nr:hypothetical protein Lal_00043007 [Lupinus albus]
MAQPPTPLGPRERTLRELAAPDFTYDSLCIQYEDVPYVLKTGLIHLLAKFYGLAGQDPHKYLKEFHIVYSTTKPYDVMEDHICLKAFPHSLEGPTKDWLYYLAPCSITSWGDLKRSFLGKFFPASRTTAIRKDISGIRQQHVFYEGLNNMDWSIIDAASGGALGYMTPFEARSLIEKMASNSQQFNARSGDAIVVRGVHDVGTNAARQDKLETKIDSLTTLITQLAINQQKSSMARVCGICISSDHYSDKCPSLLEPRTGDHPEAYDANIYNNRPPHQQQHYDPPSSSTYNPGWRNQAPFQNNNVGQNRSSYVPPPIQQQRHQMINTPAPTEPSLEELVRLMTMQNMQFQQETRASIQRQESSIQNLTTQMGQMATSLNTLQSQNSDKLPSQTMLNPRNDFGRIKRFCPKLDRRLNVIHAEEARDHGRKVTPSGARTSGVDDPTRGKLHGGSCTHPTQCTGGGCRYGCLSDIGNARYSGGVPQLFALNVVAAKVFLFRERNSPKEWGILPDSRLSERTSPKREDQCFEIGNSWSLAQARNGSLEREEAC